MLSWQQLEQLEKLDTGGARVLSTYVDLEPGLQVKRSYMVEFKDLIKDVSGRLEKPERAAFTREVERVATWLDDQREPRGQGQGLAVFSCSPRELWQAHFVPMRVRNHISFESKPDVSQLVELVDDYDRFCVALVSKDRARLLVVFAGEIEEMDSFVDFVPGRTDMGALSQANIQRHHQNHVHAHLKRVVEHLAALQRDHGFDRLIIAGPEEATSELRDMLPHRLNACLGAVIPAETDASNAELLQKALEIERQIESKSEEQIVHDVIEISGSGGRATCGVLRTLEALWIGDVRTLVVSDGAHFSGCECPNCGRMEAAAVSVCPACGATLQPTHDLGHRIVGRTLEQRGRVEVVHGPSAQRLMQAGQGLGALLRFNWPAGVLESQIRPAPGA